MPAAELFGAWAVAEAAARAGGEAPQAVIAVGDCDPAAAVGPITRHLQVSYWIMSRRGAPARRRE
eukprot:2031958-Pleurochrysis_carterae.AAC.1